MAPGTTPLVSLLDTAALELEAANSVLAEAALKQLAISPAAEWLLDNYYLIEDQIRAVRDDLPADYGRELPWLTTGAHERFPRIYEGVVTLVEHTDSRIDEDYLLGFVDGYQDAEPLAIGEVWAVPIMLRVALVENSRRLARSIVSSHEATRVADDWADQLLLTAQDQPGELRSLIDGLDAQAPPSSTFFIRLSQRLQGQDHGADVINAWLERRLIEAGISLDTEAQLQQQEQAADQISIANTITSIRFLDAYDWKTFFEKVSFVEHILREDPIGVYPRMDFKSRDRYRHAIETMARRCPHSEIEVAEAVVSSALDALERNPSSGVVGHVGYHIISEGRYALENAVDYRLHGRERLYRGPLRRRGLLYWGALSAITVLFASIIAVYGWSTGAATWCISLLAVVSVLPVSDLALSITNRLSAWLYPPRMLPKLDYREPVLASHRTLTVVPALLTSVNSVCSVFDNLEIAYLSNRDDNVAFGVLGDLRAAPGQHAAPDADIILAATRRVDSLNDRYGAEHGRRPFHLFIRDRTFSETENAWMGWERKRGSLVELNRLLRGSVETSFAVRLGDEDFLNEVTFVITLDADTILPRDGARKLVATIAHPLNRARFTLGEGRVHKGYGLIQPRVGMSLPASAKSFFAWLYSGVTGIDPYSGAVSDTYQDVFGEGSFTGKGIYEVSLFNAVLEGRVPQGALLSHDMLEGCYLRTALASDIEVLDDYPASYLSHCARLHRWVRGDWQTLPWLFPRVPVDGGKTEANPLSALHRWKIIDNLRRSLVAPSTLLLITLGWLLLPGPAWAWPVLIMGVILFPVYFSLIDSLVLTPRSVSFSAVSGAIWQDFARDSARTGLNLLMLPHQAWLMTDAIARALWRMWFSRRNMLEWETAAEVERRSTSEIAAFVRRMWPSSALAVALTLIGSIHQPARLFVALPLMLVWAAAPLVAWRASRIVPPEVTPLNADERTTLRHVARRTWRFFDTFATAETHWLAPDNFQEDPNGEVAYRTSPTNIGLQLLSFATAFDLGYVTLEEFVSRTSDTLSSMAGLERFRGHFYNWYDILTLKPLPPNYVSTVDSGNLAGHLLVLRIALLEASEGPFLGDQLLRGLLDSMNLAEEDLFADHAELDGDGVAVQELRGQLAEMARTVQLEDDPRDLGGWHLLMGRLEALTDNAAQMAGDIVSRVPGARDSDERLHPFPKTAAERVRQSIDEIRHLVRGARSALDMLTPWADLVERVPGTVLVDPRLESLRPLLSFVPSLVGLAEGLAESQDTLASMASDPPGTTDAEKHLAAQWASAMLEGLEAGRLRADTLLARLRLNANIAREMWEHTDFRMLFDAQRLLFSIGYNTAEGRLDGSYYDMLASECRLASFLAIAKGDVPQEHWFRLGRSLTGAGGRRALLSWSASMFEYLMPLLVMRRWPRTLLDETYETVVRRQMQYAAERGVPWGISESAFNAKDAQLTYQYQAFGVPGLGLKRGLSDDVVIAPYASILALPITPKAVMHNLAAFTDRGARGRYGYFESIDYTPGRVPAGQSRAIVKAYFAHHQGMSLVALGNELTDYLMHDRFHSDPMVASAELLLQERVPRAVELAHPHVEEVRHVTSIRELPPPVTRSYPLADTPVPATHFLSNGSYSVMITNGGGGYSRWRSLAVSRYREDVTRDCWGQFFYLRDVDTGRVWNAASNPSPAKPDEYHVTFSADKAEFRRHDGDLETHMEVSVSPEDDVEVRRITVANRGHIPRRLEIASYFEIALTEQAADQAHKAFSNLFVETEAVEEARALLFSRRPRSAEEDRPWGFHLVACEHEGCTWSYETDRSRFLGRHRQSDDPLALKDRVDLSGTTGAVLDPCCSIRQGAEIEAGGSVRFIFITGVAPSRDEAIRLTEKYRDVRSTQRAIDLAWTASQIELRNLGISGPEAVVLQRLASRLLLTDPYSRLKVTTPVENGLSMSGLWSLGISGDNPILLVRIEELEHTPLVRQALLAHQYWRHKGLVSDLVVLNTRPTAYVDELDERLKLLVRTGHALQLVDKPGGIFLRRADQMHPDVLNLLLGVARATLEGDGGPIELQLNQRGQRPTDPDALVPVRRPADHPVPALQRPELLYDNGYGGIDTRNDEYVIVLEGDDVTPAPWVNVMATPDFGCMVSEAGVGCTWALNSHENRITTWNNDPVSDGSGEAFYIRDEETGEFWSPTPLPVRDPAPYVIRHGKGYSRFEHNSHGLEQSLDWFVSVDDPIRVARVRLRNTTDQPRRLTVTQFVEWSLGSSRSKAQHLVVTWYDPEARMLTAHNHFNMDFPGRAAFVAANRDLHSFTGSRTEFVGRNGRPANPASLHRKRLDGRTGRYLDNCGALMVEVEIAPGAEEEVCFFLGQTAKLQEARALVERYRAEGAVDAAFARAGDHWREILRSVEVRSPEPALDVMVNGQLLYQAIACRLWGRTATYQSSGAYGFRDQLQDSLCTMFVRPELLRAQIVEASRHQFPAGDVLHWWQPYSGRGVRTRITDDRHWLPYATALYVEATGDTGVLHETTAFVEGSPVDADREDNYLQPATSETAATVYEHCIRALESARATGSHGLPLMGGGDWNDGMNRVGIQGRGESVWLAWFLGATLRQFAPVCEMMGDAPRAEEYRAWALRLAEAVEANGWDGSWYRRAYFDDGTPLGSHEADECRIDAIAQAWATISGLGDPERAVMALDAVEEKLVRREDKLIALLTPPFDHMEHDPGYIKGYVPGVRENGGQYTHAALWVALAHLLQGDGNEGVGLLSLINPINHARSRDDANAYKVEPYVVAADVYAVPPHTGRGGWTWYTGSAGWFYRVAVQYVFGLQLIANHDGRFFTVDPCIPKAWPGYEIVYRFGSTTYRIFVSNPRGVNRGVARLELDGFARQDLRVPLVDDGATHDVTVTLLGG